MGELKGVVLSIASSEGEPCLPESDCQCAAADPEDGAGPMAPMTAELTQSNSQAGRDATTETETCTQLGGWPGLGTDGACDRMEAMDGQLAECSAHASQNEEIAEIVLLQAIAHQERMGLELDRWKDCPDQTCRAPSPQQSDSSEIPSTSPVSKQGGMSATTDVLEPLIPLSPDIVPPIPAARIPAADLSGSDRADSKPTCKSEISSERTPCGPKRAVEKSQSGRQPRGQKAENSRAAHGEGAADTLIPMGSRSPEFDEPLESKVSRRSADLSPLNRDGKKPVECNRRGGRAEEAKSSNAVKVGEKKTKLAMEPDDVLNIVEKTLNSKSRTLVWAGLGDRRNKWPALVVEKGSAAFNMAPPSLVTLQAIEETRGKLLLKWFGNPPTFSWISKDKTEDFAQCFQR